MASIQAYTPELRPKLVGEDGRNTADIFCPLEKCRGYILRKGQATLVQRDAGVLDLPQASSKSRHTDDKQSPFPPSSSSSSSTDTLHDVWLVTSALTFENIGFTKGVQSDSNGDNIRFLSCADCDCGPLGWHVEAKGKDLGKEVEQMVGQQGSQAGSAQSQGSEFLLAVDRCRYRLA